MDEERIEEKKVEGEAIIAAGATVTRFKMVAASVKATPPPVPKKD